MLENELQDDLGHKNEGSKTPKCLNCNSPLPSSEKYCTYCGQKNSDGRITFKQFIEDFFDAAFSLDSRLFKTIPNLFIPGKLTRVYFSGKHNAYFKPLRLFFTTMIVFYAVLGIMYLPKIEKAVTTENDMKTFIQNQHTASLIDSAIKQIDYSVLTENEKQTVDSILTKLREPYLDELLDSISIAQWGGEKFKFSLNDLYNLEPDSILDIYQIDGFGKRVLVKQTILISKSPGKVVRFMVGNTTWMIILMLPAIAIIMKLLYVRRKRYFIEHLIFLYHYHATVFVTLTIYILLFSYFNNVIIILIPSLLAAFLLVSLKVYYNQGWFRTFVKFCILSMGYIAMMIFFGMITSLVSFLVYQ